LIHVDIKKIAGIPDGGGWRNRGRGFQGVDDRTRIVYSEIHSDEKAVTAAGFWTRAAAWYQMLGIECQRVITDNGGCYKSGLWHRACRATGITVKKTRPRRPQTNGKVERFHRILLEEWAYIRPWISERQRSAGYDGFIHSTITIDPTDRSNGPPPSASSRTTSPKSTPRRRPEGEFREFPSFLRTGRSIPISCTIARGGPVP